MPNEIFRRNLSEAIKRAGDKADLVVRKAVIELASNIVMRSPVDTGRFRANWMYAANGIRTEISDAVDPSGQAAIDRVAVGVGDFKRGDVMWLSNSLPYAYRLEHGWSKQAPQGMLNLALVDFEQMFKKAAE